MFVIQNKKIFLAMAFLLIGVSTASILMFGLKLGIDFTGGSLLEVSYQNDNDNHNDAGSTLELQIVEPDQEQMGEQPVVEKKAEQVTDEGVLVDNIRPEVVLLHERLDVLELGGYSLQPSGESGYILKMRPITGEERLLILDVLSLGGEYTMVEERFTTIGPTLGNELKRKAIVGLVAVLAMIIIFIAWAFRKVSRPISSWKYGVVAIITLFHDVIIPTGVFALLGYVSGVEIDLLFLTALLAILGYSVNDTIVVFDRIRENLANSYRDNHTEGFDTIVGRSLKETYTRSINTSLTTALVLGALLYFGSPATVYFSLALLIGVIAGTYSSIFLASPLLVFIYEKFGGNQ